MPFSFFQSFFTRREKLIEKNSFIRTPYYSTREKLLYRIENDLQKGDLLKAINRLEGAMEYYSFDEALNYRLANLYLQNNDLIKAGRRFYLIEDKTEIEKHAVVLFEKSFGNDPTMLLKRLLKVKRYMLRELTDFQLTQLNRLLKQSQLREGKTPRFLFSLEAHIKKRAKHLRSTNNSFDEA